MGNQVVAHTTVLFTDLVGSTAMRARLGEELADEVRRTHDALLTEEVQRHAGAVVKGIGDGVMASFSSTAGAVSAAVAIQQAAELHSRRHRGHAFEVRIGISAGDVSVEDDDLFGTPVIEAARLCGAAAGGQILAAQVVEVLARGRGDHRFTRVSDLDLKGIPEPVPAVEVGWAPSGASSFALPASLSTTGALPFAGRSALMAEMLDAWKRAHAGMGEIVLLAGEPGAGKTRLAAELARHVGEGGGAVLCGRCDDTLPTAYLSVIEAYRSALAQHAESRPTELLGPAASQLTRLVPELLARDPDLVVTPPEDPETDRYRTLTAIPESLGHLAAAGGLVLVLDDLHWADSATAQVLRHLARTGVPDRVLIVGTYRDTDVEPDQPFGQVIGDLRREAAVGRLLVGGLDEAGLAELLDAASGDDAYLADERDRLASLLLAETEGNPFFVSEVLRHLIESGVLTISDGTWHLMQSVGDAGVPDGVRDVVARRLSILGEGARATLVSAAVAGPRFEAATVAAVSGAELETVLDHLDEAAGAFLVDEEGVGRYRFTHALVRASLYDSLSTTRRSRMHLRIAEHLEASRPDEVGSLAHHWYQAANLSSDAASKAIAAAVRAGEAAMGADAPDTAIDAFARALELADDHDYGDGVWRVETETQLAIAERISGRGDCRARLERCARLALEIGRAELAAEAMVADRGVIMILGDITAERRSLQEAVITAASGLPVGQRFGLLAQRANDAALTRDISYRDRVVDEALDGLARLDLGERAHANAAADGLGLLLYPSFASLRLDLHERLVGHLERMAERVEGRRKLLADFNLTSANLQRGRLDRAQAHMERTLVTADRLREPFLRAIPFFMVAAVELAKGRISETQAALARFSEASALSDDPDLPVWLAAAELTLCYQGGGLAGHADLTVMVADADSEVVPWTCAAAATLADAARPEEANRYLDRAADADFGMAHPDLFAGVGLAWAALAASSLQSAHRARILELLDALPVTLCTAAALHLGPPQYGAGLLCLSLGDHDGAVMRFASAAERMDAIGAQGYAAMARGQLATALEERGDRNDLSNARRLATHACAAATELGTGNVVEVCGHLARLT